MTNRDLSKRKSEREIEALAPAEEVMDPAESVQERISDIQASIEKAKRKESENDAAQE